MMTKKYLRWNNFSGYFSIMKSGFNIINIFQFNILDYDRSGFSILTKI